jgi:very-short-patch-repair endonuclease
VKALADRLAEAFAERLHERVRRTVKHQVGCGPYKLDLAVVDPADPERFVLAIEHDGASYRNAPSARSRDRLRTQLLMSLGWRVHRIWSLDWWVDAEREVQRAHGAIVAAIAASRQRRTTVPPGPRLRARASIAPRVPPRVTTPPTMAVAPKLGTTSDDTTPMATGEAVLAAGSGALAAAGEAVLAAGSGPTDAVGLVAALPEGSGPITPLRLPRGAIGIGPYTAAAVPAGRRAPDDMFLPRYATELGKCIEQVLSAEAPVHIDVLARRVGAYFGVGKITPRVVEAVKISLAGRGKLGEEQSIVWRVDQDPASVPSVRVAGQGLSARRDISEVPLAEVAAAARIVVERANGLAASDLVRDCARLLGFARITEQVSTRVSLGVRLATVRELISIDGGKAHLMLE